MRNKSSDNEYESTAENEPNIKGNERPKKREDMKTEEISVESTIKVGNKYSHNGYESTEDNKRVNTIRREVKVAQTLAIITMAYIICFLPANLSIIISIWIKYMKHRDLYIHLTLWIVLINSMINPILYAYFNHNFKKAFNDIFISWRIRKPISHNLVLKT